MITKFTAFWEVTLYTLSATNQRFGEPSCNHLEGILNSLHGVNKTIAFFFLCQFWGFQSGVAGIWRCVNGLMYPTLRSKLVASSPSRLEHVAWRRQDPITQSPKRHIAIPHKTGIINFSFGLFDSTLQLHAVTNGAKQWNSSSCFCKWECRELNIIVCLCQLPLAAGVLIVCGKGTGARSRAATTSQQDGTIRHNTQSLHWQQNISIDIRRTVTLRYLLNTSVKVKLHVFSKIPTKVWLN
jgi:hypothetical protein